MSRDFSREKREELYRALDTLDEREWKPFMVWCGRRADEFGEWAERLGISSYTKQIDHFQDRVLEINNSTRNQIDIVFEEVAETDRRYADTLWGHAETVREQVRRVQVMLQAMQSADRTGTEIGMLFYDRNPQPGIPHEELFERGQRVLRSYLKVREDADPAEQQKICNLIMKRQPGMLAGLYLKDYNSDKDASTIYHSIMEYYTKHKMDITIEDVEGLTFSGLPLQQIQKETFVECWNYLFSMGLTVDQVIAVIANLHAEGELSPTNRQNTKKNKNIEDPDYIYLVDDNVGYGIFQWTYHSRKKGLLEKANEMGKEVSDLDVQLAYFRYEMEESQDFKKVWTDFRAIQDRNTAIVKFYCEIEKPETSLDKNSDEYKKAVSKRIGYADDIERWYETTFNQ